MITSLWGNRTGSISCIETSLDLHSMNQFLIELSKILNGTMYALSHVLKPAFHTGVGWVSRKLSRTGLRTVVVRGSIYMAIGTARELFF